MPNRKRYVVETFDSKGSLVREGFTKPGIESLKALDAVVFKGTRRSTEGTVYVYNVKRSR